MHRLQTLFAALTLWLAALAGPAAAGVLCLADGRIFTDLPMSREADGVRVTFENGEVLVPNELILDCVVDDDGGYVPETEEEREKLAEGLVRFEGRWMSERRRDDLIAERIEERRAEIEAMRAHQEWAHRLTERTRNFEFEYTVPEHICAYYRELMEAYFKAFAKTWRIKSPKERLRICFYGDRDSFKRTGGVRGALGYFRFVEPMELNMYYSRTDPRLTEEVMYHEVNHYLQKLIDVDFRFPHFPGEAIAEYYGASRFDRESGELETGLVLEGRLTEIQTQIAADEWLGLEKLVSTDGMYEHYTWGWSLVHFLMNDRKYAKSFQKFVLALPKAKDIERVDGGFGLRTVRPQEVWRAFRKYLGLKKPEDVVELQQAWHAYLEDNLHLVTPRGKELAGFAAIRAGRPIRARRLLEEAIEEGSKSALAHHRLAELLADDGETGTARKHWRKALELDPLNPDVYVALGELEREKGKKEEGARLVRLAAEIDPDDRDVRQALRDVERDAKRAAD